MNWKTTAVLLVLVVGFGAYLKLYELKRPDTAEAARQAQKVLNFDRDKVDGITIQNGDDKIDIRRNADKWRLEKPIKDQADPSLISTLLFDLESWQKDSTISAREIEADKNKLSEYGLIKPKLRLKLSGAGAPAEILFGKDAALEGKMYVRFDGSKEALIVSQTLKKEIDKKPEDFRDRRLTDLALAQVGRVVLKTPAGEMELQKKNEHWEILKPLRARADDQKVNDLIAQVTTAHIEQFVADDRGDLHPYGLAEPRGSVTLFGKDDKSAGRTDSSRGEQGQMLQIGTVPEKNKDQVYVRFTSRGFVYTLPKKIEEILNTKPDDLRDRHLARIDTNILDRITVEPSPVRTGPKGKTVLARKGEDWSIASMNSVPANSAQVRRLIQTLQGEQVTKFVEDVASNLAKYGLDKPQMQVTFSSFASENTAETKAGEKPFATLAFGNIDGDNVYARVSEEPFVVAVKRSVLDEIFTDPLQWQNLSIFKFKPDQIRQLGFTTAAGEQSLERDEKQSWHWAKGEGEINRANVQSVINTLSSLYAIRWAGPTPKEQGLEAPQVTISFVLRSEKKSSTLKIGAKTSDGMWYASVDNRQGTFVMSNPDHDKLTLSLVQKATLSPSPSPSPNASP
jgi:hypothetical protein